MSVKREDLLEVAQEALDDLGIQNYRDLYLTLFKKAGNEWRVNFSYIPSWSWSNRVGCFAVNRQTDEITYSALDRVWKA